MDGMPMPGGWNDVEWHGCGCPDRRGPAAAASFAGMWIVMMVAMMLPSVRANAVALPRGHT